MAALKAPKQEYSKLAVEGGTDDHVPLTQRASARTNATALPLRRTVDEGADNDDGDDAYDDDIDGGMFFLQRRRTGVLFMGAVGVMSALFLLIVFLVVRRNQIKTALDSSNGIVNGGAWNGVFPDDVVAMMDAAVDPCDDFYQFACGKWVDENEIPPEKTSVYASFTAVQDRNEAVLRDILAENWPFLGELHSSCMNMSAINATGIAPLKASLTALSRVKTKHELFTLAGQLAATGPDFLTGLAIAADAKDATKYVLYASQSGLTLPDPEYYLDASKFNDTENEFRKFVSTMFTLSGWSKTSAQTNEERIVAFERKLATLFVPKEELRDPVSTYNLVKLTDAQRQYPLLFAAYFNGTGIEAKAKAQTLSTIVVETPRYFEAAEKLVAEADLETLRTVMTYQYIQHFAATLSEPFVDAVFTLFKKKLSGQQQHAPRWKVCLRQVTSYFPNLIGKYYFLKQFDLRSEVAANELVQQIEAAMQKRLTKLPWLDAATRDAATKKLHLVTNLIGHSTKQEKFPFVLSDTELATNMQILAQYQFDKIVGKLGTTVDRTEWYMTAADVNAYYSPSTNQIVFPAGILQPPFFSSKNHAARNFGAIGSIIGHELTHGFDSQGRYYDGDGNLVSWWTNETEKEFASRAKCLVDQYDSFQVTSAFDATRVLGNINGNFTLSENIADNGGVKLSYNAFLKYLTTAQRTPAGDAPVPSDTDAVHIDDTLSLVNAQKLFFLSFAQAFCSKTRDEAMVRRLNTDPHSPETWRVNAVMMNSDDFAAAFQCPVRSNMNPEKKCKLW
uniref:Peptidase M13 N-terminal domain-containing protein n=1 Tax=Globisporangium ultimum (strain ATCC 200006 / CBS 805.95 / DAOM BR144) TaxID=431595 RepID=K3WDF6_GLOUD